MKSNHSKIRKSHLWPCLESTMLLEPLLLLLLAGTVWSEPVNPGSVLEINGSRGEDEFDGRCGVRGMTAKDRIVSGSPVPEYQLPWQVLLKIKKTNRTSKCGGSIFSDRWILTAAHCATGGINATIYAGRYDRNHPTAVEQVRKAAKFIIHEGYDPEAIDNDISLIRLDEPFQLSSHIRPVCLPLDLESDDEFDGQIGVVAGWGTTSFKGPSSDVLLQVSLTVFSTARCRTFLGYESDYITDQMICTYEKGKDSCQGDSGGPLTWEKNGRVLQIGIVSFGKGCAARGHPGVYTKVTRFLSWIDANME